MTPEELKALKDKRDELMRQATAAAHDYAAACDVGDERCHAFDIYENLRCAGRVYE